MRTYSICYTCPPVTKYRFYISKNSTHKIEYGKILSLPDFFPDTFELTIINNENNVVPFLHFTFIDTNSKFIFWSDDNDKYKSNFLNPGTIKFDFNTRTMLVFNHKFLYNNPDYKSWEKEMYGDVLIQFNKKGWKHFLNYLVDFYKGDTKDDYWKKIH